MEFMIIWSIYLIGILGIMLNRRNIIIILMSIELLLVGVNMNFIMYSIYLDDAIGEIFAIFILTVAASETAVGLGILITYYRIRGYIGMDAVNVLQG